MLAQQMGSQNCYDGKTLILWSVGMVMGFWRWVWAWFCGGEASYFCELG